MTKEEELKQKYTQAQKNKEKADAEFYKALNEYFAHIHGETLGPVIGDSSTLKW